MSRGGIVVDDEVDLDRNATKVPSARQSDSCNEKTWGKYGNIVFLGEDDDLFQSSDEEKDTQAKGRSVEQHSVSNSTGNDGRAKDSVQAVRSILRESDPGRSSRKVAFDVEEDEGEEEKNRFVQSRCVCFSFLMSYAMIPRFANLDLGRV